MRHSEINSSALRASLQFSSFAMLALITLLLALPAEVEAQPSWAIAQRTDEEITSRVEKLRAHLDDTPGLNEASAVILEKGEQLWLQEATAGMNFEKYMRALRPKICRNIVALVREPNDLPPRITQPYFGPGEKVDEIAAFHLRGNKITRLGDDDWRIEEGDTKIRRDQVVFTYPELKKGDVVGFSIVSLSEHPFLGGQIPAADRLPVVYASFRLRANGRIAYAIGAQGVPEEDVNVKVESRENGRAAMWMLSLRQLAAVEDLPLEGPYPDDVPRFVISPSEAYVASEAAGFAEWTRVTGWNVAAMIIPQLVRPEALESKGVDVPAAAVTTGKASPEAKAEAICDYVRDQIRLLEGDAYSAHGLRKTAKEILSAKEATAMEKVFLMAVMLESAGVEAQVVLARPTIHGSPDSEQTPLTQFGEGMIRMGGDPARYFVPQCTECPAGAIPAMWNGAAVFVPQSDIEEVSGPFMQQLQNNAMRDGTFSPRSFVEAIDGQRWYSVEMIPATDEGS